MRTSILLRFLPAALLLGFAACSDDGPDSLHHVHYFNPAWTPDSKIVAFGLDEAVRPSSQPAATESSQMRLVFPETGERRTIVLPNANTHHNKYEFEVSNKVLAVLGDGVRFYDIDGNPLWYYDRNDEGFVPEDFDLLPSGNGFLWGDTREGRTHIAITRYDRNSWSETGEQVLKDTTMPGEVLTLTLTSHRTYAVRMSTGDVHEFDFSGELIASYQTTPFSTDNINHQRLVYTVSPPPASKRQLYLLEREALSLIDLDAQTLARLVTGGIRDFSLHSSGNFMVYETFSADTWFSLSSGYPLTRILPHHMMPRFSPNGKWLAAIALIDGVADTLTIIHPQISE